MPVRDPTGNAAEVLGVSRARIDIIRELQEHDVTVSQLMRAVELSRNGALRHLCQLGRGGAVQRIERRVGWSYRPVALYRLDEVMISEVAWWLVDELAGRQAPMSTFPPE